MKTKRIKIGMISLIVVFTAALVLLPIQVLSGGPMNGCVTEYHDPGFTATLVGGSTWNMPGSMSGGYLLCTNGDPNSEYHLQFAGTLSTSTLDAGPFGLYLISSTVSPAELKAYYDNRGTPEPYLTYLKNAADGTEPFAYIEGLDQNLLDGAMWAIHSIETDMRIPGDYPEGTYTVRGTITNDGECPTEVTFKLIISRCLPGEVEEAVWVRTLPMTCSKVWINKDGCFEFVFFWEYKNNNWVKIYDKDSNEVFSIDMKYGNPRFEACLDDGMYTVKTFHNDMANPIQEFTIGKP
jgi:hypothetical protein